MGLLASVKLSYADVIGVEPLLPGSQNRTDAINRAFTVAQRAINRACSAPEVIATARRNAEAVLRPMFQAVGWKLGFAWGERASGARAPQ